MKNLKIMPLILVLLLSLSLLPVSAMALSEPEIGANAAIIVDANSGEIYYEKNADQQVQPASTTKIMTALLVIEAVEKGDISLSDVVTVSDSCLYNLEDDSTDASPRLESGEEISVENLLYCVMLPSANEACNALAEYLSGSVSAFVSLMNERASELGCTNTHFANANGLEESDHYSSAADLARIAKEALAHPTFVQICGTYSRDIPATNVADVRELENSNKLLEEGGSYYYSPAYGIKTGFFTNAGYCLVSAAEKDDKDVICVVMGAQELGDQFLDSITLYDWFFDNHEYRQILSTMDTVATVPVEMGTSDTVGVRAEEVVSVILPNDYDASNIGYRYTLTHEENGTKLEAPVNAGDTLGEITVVEMNGDGEVVRTFGTSRLVAASSVEMSRMEYIRTQIGNLFREPTVRKIIIILILLLAVYLLLVVVYYVQRVRHLASVRQAKRERAIRQTADEAQWLSMPDEPEPAPQIDFFSGEEEPVNEKPAKEPRPDNVVPVSLRRQQEPAKKEPVRRVPPADFADDDFFDSFFKD